MERKIGEIFDHNGEWYQCVGGTCRNCSFYYDTVCKNITTIGSTNFGNCHCSLRTDHKSVIFKKLEKVGKPFSNEYFGLVQKYELKMYGYSTKDKRVCFADGYDVFIKIKQNKEDMEDNKLNLKPFDIQKAREGKPVCTRDGHKARIICFDYNGETGDYPIVALVHYNKGNKCYERVLKYTSDGMFNKYRDYQHDDDLMMAPEKKEGWVNVYYDNDASSHRGCRFIYDTKERAVKEAGSAYITTVKINWEE